MVLYISYSVQITQNKAHDNNYAFEKWKFNKFVEFEKNVFLFNGNTLFCLFSYASLIIFCCYSLIIEKKYIVTKWMFHNSIGWNPKVVCVITINEWFIEMIWLWIWFLYEMWQWSGAFISINISNNNSMVRGNPSFLHDYNVQLSSSQHTWHISLWGFRSLNEILIFGQCVYFKCRWCIWKGYAFE